MLREYFQNGRAGLDRETAEILADHLHATVGRVIEIAKEIDNEYASPADSSWRRPCTGLGLIRFGGHLPKGEYDVDHDGGCPSSC